MTSTTARGQKLSPPAKTRARGMGASSTRPAATWRAHAIRLGPATWRAFTPTTITMAGLMRLDRALPRTIGEWGWALSFTGTSADKFTSYNDAAEWLQSIGGHRATGADLTDRGRVCGVRPVRAEPAGIVPDRPHGRALPERLRERCACG